MMIYRRLMTGDAMQTLVALIFAGLAAYNFGPEIGYRYWGVRDAFGAAFYGGGTVFMGAMLLGLYVVWPILRSLGNSLFGGVSAAQLATRRKLRAPAPILEGDLEATVRRGIMLSYDGLIDRDYSFQEAGRWERLRVRRTFTVQRNTGTIPRREQQAVIMFETLNREARLGKDADRLRLALAWGDGRCETKAGNYAPPPALGFRSFKDMLAAEAGRLEASMDAAITVLYTRLQQAAEGKNPSEAAKRLLDRYRAASEAGAGDMQWS